MPIERGAVLVRLRTVLRTVLTRTSDLLEHRDGDYTELARVQFDTPQLRTAASAQLDSLSCEPAGGATVGPHAAAGGGAANWVADQAQSLLDPLANHPRYMKISDLHK